MNTEKELADLRSLGLVENEDAFLSEFMDYGKVVNARRKTITAKELEKNPEILNAYEQIECYLDMKRERII